ncbi:hypothetical protein [Trinickia sp.]|uniref:hypothetical protein n=1 Tax=Trinickia sp. TaxID=2571163 RepID=UPI003F7D7A8A
MDDETIEGRFALLDDRLDHFGERIDALEEGRQEKHARAINWAMLALFVVEVVIGVAELWMMRHA